jgi:hypothetical protein
VYERDCLTFHGWAIFLLTWRRPLLCAFDNQADHQSVIDCGEISGPSGTMPVQSKPCASKALRVPA